MLGNLVDNACEWAQAPVSVELTPDRAEGAPPRRTCASGIRPPQVLSPLGSAAD
jgi:hypothetical protein